MQLVRHDSHAAAFCAMSIAYTTPYTLITSLLSHWTGLLGPRRWERGSACCAELSS